MKQQSGQAILAIILIMTVALAIGVSIIQKSLVDVSTSTKVEQSQRAFSAAEAGVEEALRGADTTHGVSLSNQSSATVLDTSAVPYTARPGILQEALEYPAISKEEFAHIWLSDPTSNLPNCDSGKICYTQNALDVYWGNAQTTDKPAIQVKIIYFDGSSYQAKAFYFDSDPARLSSNGFTLATGCTNPTTNTILGTSRSFYCNQRLDLSSIFQSYPNAKLMLARIRLLYTTSSQPVALQAVGTCGTACSLPAQARVVVSTGSSGQSQRSVQVFQINNVVPPYFDFAIFSAGPITK